MYNQIISFTPGIILSYAVNVSQGMTQEIVRTGLVLLVAVTKFSAIRCTMRIALNTSNKSLCYTNEGDTVPELILLS